MAYSQLAGAWSGSPPWFATLCDGIDCLRAVTQETYLEKNDVCMGQTQAGKPLCSVSGNFDIL